MRCYQHIGLTPEAESFLTDNVEMIPNICCPKCGEIISYKMNSRVVRVEELFYNDGPCIIEYKLKDGRTCTEIVQCSPWNSGPMGFMCLEIDGQKMFEWSDDEINQYF